VKCVGCHEKSGPLTFNGGTSEISIEISRNKKRKPMRMVPQRLSKSNIVKIFELLDMLLSSNFVNKQGIEW